MGQECTATYEGVMQGGGMCRICGRAAGAHRREAAQDWSLRTFSAATPEATPAATPDYTKRSTGRYESPALRTKIIVILLALVIVVDLIAVASDVAELRLIERAGTSVGITEEEADANDIRQGAIGGLQLLFYAATIAFFIAWLHRMYRNSIAFGEPRPRYGLGWTIGGWFVPVLNLWRPKQIVNDVWHSTEPSKAPGNRSASVPLLLGVWWAAWIVNGILAQVWFVTDGEAETLEQLRTSSQILLASDGFDAVAAALALAVVLVLTRAHEARAERIRLESAPVEPAFGDPWPSPADA